MPCNTPALATRCLGCVSGHASFARQCPVFAGKEEGSPPMSNFWRLSCIADRSNIAFTSWMPSRSPPLQPKRHSAEGKAKPVAEDVLPVSLEMVNTCLDEAPHDVAWLQGGPVWSEEWTETSSTFFPPNPFLVLSHGATFTSFSTTLLPCVSDYSQTPDQ